MVDRECCTPPCGSVENQSSTPVCENTAASSRIVRPWEISPVKQQPRLPTATAPHVPYWPVQTTPPATQRVSTVPALHSTPPSDDSGYVSVLSTSTSPSTTSTTEKSSSASERRQLNLQAVYLMEQWYKDHFDHPYPCDETVQLLSKAGGITFTQVKKWMANKRVRSYNTLSFNGSVHPRKLRRMQRMQQYRQIYSKRSTSEATVPARQPALKVQQQRVPVSHLTASKENQRPAFMHHVIQPQPAHLQPQPAHLQPQPAHHMPMMMPIHPSQMMAMWMPPVTRPIIL